MIQGKPPLTDSDYADVRTSVLQTIAARERRKTWAVRSLQLGFAVIAIAFVTIWLVRTPAATKSLPSARTAQTSNPATRQLSNQTTHQPSNPPTQQASNQTTEQPSNSFTQQPRNPLTQQPHVHLARRRSHHQAAVALVASAAPLRIELATNDPDIRIIWITNPNESR